MKFLLTKEYVKIPEEVTISIKSRKITVRGPNGEITKNFKHMSVELKKVNLNTKKNKGAHIEVTMWFGRYKQTCSVNTLKSLINNMIDGVTKGYRYKMRMVHAHFPINVGIPADGRSVEIKNFLGGRHIKKIQMMPGVKITMGKTVKDELIIDGADNQAVSLSCSQISQACKIGRKDDRKFLDGIYVAGKGDYEF